MVGRDLRLPNWQVLKNMLASEGDTRDASSIPRLGRSPGVGNANPLQYSCLENSMIRGGRKESETTGHACMNEP